MLVWKTDISPPPNHSLTAKGYQYGERREVEEKVPGTATHKTIRTIRAGIGRQWVRLKRPYVFNGFRFLVEVRAENGVASAPKSRQDVRVRGPLCVRCGVPLARVESTAAYERYACRKGRGHCELWVGRVSHLSFGEFMQEQLRPKVYKAIRDKRLPLETAAIGAALNIAPC